MLVPSLVDFQGYVAYVAVISVTWQVWKVHVEFGLAVILDEPTCGFHPNQVTFAAKIGLHIEVSQEAEDEL